MEEQANKNEEQEKTSRPHSRWVLYSFVVPLAYATYLGSLWITLPVVAAAFYVVWLLWTKALGDPPSKENNWALLGYDCSFWMALAGVVIAVPLGLKEMAEDQEYAALAAVYTSAIWLAGSLILYYAAKPLDNLVKKRRG